MKISMAWLFRWIRYILLIGNLVIATAILFYLAHFHGYTLLLAIKLTQVYGLLSLAWLWYSLLPSPFYAAFPTFPYRALTIRARRATGVSAFLFASLHSAISFFIQLGGFHGLAFLGLRYLWAIGLGALALLILTLMALTSFDKTMKLLGKYWKRLHRFVYIAGWAILIHTLMLGSHYINLLGFPAQLTLALIIFLLCLEALRFDSYLTKRWRWLPANLLAMLVIIGLASLAIAIFLFPRQFGILSLHTNH